MLMLIDTPDPRYRPEPDRPREPWGRRHPTARVRVPFVLAVVCMLAAYIVSSPLLIFGLSMASTMLFFDAILALLPTGDGLWSHRQ
jgi:hypothetical protein